MGAIFPHDVGMILELHSPLDMHLHLRDGDMMKLVAPLSSASFAGAVIMPNLVPPVADAGAVQAYRQQVLDACGDDVFQPYMTAFFRSYSEKELSRIKELVFGIKLYPAGATTNSEGGVKAMKDAEATLSIMQEMDIPLLVHGESHGFVMDREAEFLDVYRDLATRFPRLTICMEHITTAAAVQLLDEFENLRKTGLIAIVLKEGDELIGVELTDDETIHEINREMREVDRATDVLSFPMFELSPGELPGTEDADPGTGLVPLGDMVISLEHVAAQAKEYGHSNRRELAYLVTHSVLHLLGYDHLDEGPMKKQMREHEERIMTLLDLTR